MNITVTASRREWEALLSVLPTCTRCGARAELLVNGRLHCIPCSAGERFARVETPAWTNAADAVETALLPHIAEGSWTR